MPTMNQINASTANQSIQTETHRQAITNLRRRTAKRPSQIEIRHLAINQARLQRLHQNLLKKGQRLHLSQPRNPQRLHLSQPKKPQRLRLNPPKPTRLILRGPKKLKPEEDPADLHNLRQTPPDSIDPLDTRFNDPAIKYVRRKEDEMEEAEPINMAEEGFQRVCSARVRIPSEKKREEFWLSSKSGSMFREVKW